MDFPENNQRVCAPVESSTPQVTDSNEVARVRELLISSRMISERLSVESVAMWCCEHGGIEYAAEIVGMMVRAEFWSGGRLVFGRDGMKLKNARLVLSLLGLVLGGAGVVYAESEPFEFIEVFDGRAPRARREIEKQG